MSETIDFNELNSIIKEYLQHQIEEAKHEINPDGLSSAAYSRILEAFQKEEKQKAGKNILAKYSEYQVNKVPADRKDLNNYPKLYKMFVEDQDYENKAAINGLQDPDVKPLNTREHRLQNLINNMNNKHSSVLQSARQIFSIAINCLQ